MPRQFVDAPHRRLRVWQAAHGLALTVYEVTARWPSAERFGLTIQARRAAVSVVLNVVEGASRRGPREFARFLDIAIGSLAELECALELARDLGFSKPVDCERMDHQIAAVGKMLWRLLQSQRRAAAP